MKLKSRARFNENKNGRFYKATIFYTVHVLNNCS